MLIATVVLMQLEGALPTELVPSVERIALEGAPEVRALALKALADAVDPDPSPVIAGLSSRSLAVRVASVNAVGPIIGDACVTPLSDRLDAPEQRPTLPRAPRQLTFTEILLTPAIPGIMFLQPFEFTSSSPSRCR